MPQYTVRRLTPLECERLQGFPDGWTDIGDWVDSKGKTHKGDSDSPRYKALGNSIGCGPASFWQWIIKRISAQYTRPATMGSLFDGIGGFPMCWEFCNGPGTALWASEIEEFPIAVTKKHFPTMKHMGDITKLNGAELPPVDCIIGGSPCQDLSVAGLRKGLAGERSGLYMEQIRLIKEMRANDRPDKLGRDCRWMVWENVPGALSSNKGKDFAIVLTEAIRIVQPEAPDVPVPDRGWPTAGCLYDGVEGRWSVAWRVHDLQFWGTTDWPTPQRRRRICVVCDFGGPCAPEILFERKGLRWHPDESGTEGQGSAGAAEDRSGGESGSGRFFLNPDVVKEADTDNPLLPCTLKIRGGCAGGAKAH